MKKLKLIWNYWFNGCCWHCGAKMEKYGHKGYVRCNNCK